MTNNVSLRSTIIIQIKQLLPERMIIISKVDMSKEGGGDPFIAAPQIRHCPVLNRCSVSVCVCVSLTIKKSVKSSDNCITIFDVVLMRSRIFKIH